MFDELLRELKQLDGRQTISVSLPSDGDGYFERECPAADCQCQFKVHEDDWRDKVRDEEVFCAYCGHAAPSNQWFTQEQVKHVEAAAVAKFERRISSAMKRDAQAWNRRQRPGGFLQITMSISDTPQHFALPAAVAEPLKLRITCPRCACRYAVLGAGYFCPACGHSAAAVMFRQSLQGIRNSLSLRLRA